MRRCFLARKYALTMILLGLASLERIQAQPTFTALDGTTPPGLASGVPPDSLALSGTESIGLFSGKLAFNLPLLQIGGRGTSGYTMNLRIQEEWRMFNMYDPSVQGYGLTPSASWWEPLEVGYGPGILMLRYGAAGFGENSLCSSTTPSRVLTRLSFLGPDGTEHEFRDSIYDGKPATLNLTGTNCGASGNPGFLNRGRIFKTHDGSAMTFISDADIQDISLAEGGFVSRDLYGFLQCCPVIV